MHGTRDAASKSESVIGKTTSKSWGCQLGLSSKKLFRHDGHRVSIRVDPIPFLPVPFEGARIQRERITRQNIDEFGAFVGRLGCNAIKDNKRAQAH